MNNKTTSSDDIVTYQKTHDITQAKDWPRMKQTMWMYIFNIHRQLWLKSTSKVTNWTLFNQYLLNLMYIDLFDKIQTRLIWCCPLTQILIVCPCSQVVWSMFSWEKSSFDIFVDQSRGKVFQFYIKVLPLCLQMPERHKQQ